MSVPDLAPDDDDTWYMFNIDPYGMVYWYMFNIDPYSMVYLVHVQY